MRSATLTVTRRCDHACGFCLTPDDGRSDPSLSQLVDAARAARASGASELTIAGGDPLRRADLEELISQCRTLGFSRIELSTNAVRLAGRAKALAAAGVTSVVVGVPTMSPTLHRTLISTRTHPKLVLAGLDASLRAGVPTAVEIPLAAALPPAAGRIGGLASALPGLAEFRLAPMESAIDAAALGAEIDEAAAVAERCDVRLTVSPRHPIAPCASPLGPRAKRLLAGMLRDADGPPNAAHARCEQCALRFRCTVDAQALGRLLGERAPLPVEDATAFLRPGRSGGSRLRVLDDRDVEKFFHVDYEYDGEVDRPTSRIGVIYRCNQVCTFCELADMSTDLPIGKVHAALDAAYARGSRRVILTGGEPTLSPNLEAHVRHAKELGFTEIELQTNAVLLERAGRAQALADAGLTSAQISLHGPDSAISDRLTAAAGTHEKTLRGVDALLAAGVRCLLNHLIFRDNAHLLVDFVELVRARWGAHQDRLVIQFHSVRNEFPSAEEARAHVARYRDYAHVLRNAIDLARGYGIKTHDLQDPTGIPSLCVLGADESYLGPILAQSERPRFHAWESEWLTRVPACESCDLRHACMGVPRHYLALYGDEEFHAIAAPAARPTPA